MHELILANSATPLIYGTMFLLLGGNLIIGLIEGAILARMLDLKPVGAILAMIVANYISMIAGCMLFGMNFSPGILVTAIPVPIGAAVLYYWSLVVLSFALSILIEYPFIRMSRVSEEAPQPPSRLSTLKALVVAHLVSYALLAFWYQHSDVSMVDDVTTAVDPSLHPTLPNGAIYFIDDHMQVCVMNLDGTERTVLREASMRHSHLSWVYDTQREQPGWDLKLVEHGTDDELGSANDHGPGQEAQQAVHRYSPVSTA